MLTPRLLSQCEECLHLPPAPSRQEIHFSFSVLEIGKMEKEHYENVGPVGFSFVKRLRRILLEEFSFSKCTKQDHTGQQLDCN